MELTVQTFSFHHCEATKQSILVSTTASVYLALSRPHALALSWLAKLSSIWLARHSAIWLPGRLFHSLAAWCNCNQQYHLRPKYIWQEAACLGLADFILFWDGQRFVRNRFRHRHHFLGLHFKRWQSTLNGEGFDNAVFLFYLPGDAVWSHRYKCLHLGLPVPIHSSTGFCCCSCKCNTEAEMKLQAFVQCCTDVEMPDFVQHCMPMCKLCVLNPLKERLVQSVISVIMTIFFVQHFAKWWHSIITKM